MGTERRWRGEIDIPLNDVGQRSIRELSEQFKRAGGLDLVYHDWLSRTRDTAHAICPNTVETREGARPWRMGKAFEGHPITPASLQQAQWLVEHANQTLQPDAEPWGKWYFEWMNWLHDLPHTGKVGIVTHNRNIQAAIATVGASFYPKAYDRPGAAPCEVYRWDGQTTDYYILGDTPMPPGIYLIRHGATAFGT